MRPASFPTTCNTGAEFHSAPFAPREVAPREADAPRSIWKRISIFAAIAFWTLGIAAGFLYGFRYERTPAQTGVIRDRWPAGSEFTLSGQHPTLVMFVHPRCPCSRASLNELAVLMTHCRGRVDAQVVFFTPPTFPASWAKTDLWDSAARIPGVVPRIDPEGTERRRFRARVSGEVFLYLPNGDLSFHGGITAGRGHAGDNRGRALVESFLLKHDLPAAGTPVFGCELEARNCNPQKVSAAIDPRTVE